MRRLPWCAGLLAFVLGNVASAEEPRDDEYGAGTIELGLFVGGFLSGSGHQFYDPSLEMGAGAPQREQLESVSPQLGGRFAVFPSSYVGFEVEPSVILATTKAGGDAAEIYGLGASLLVQRPGRVTPYLGVGFDIKHVNSDNLVLGSDTDVPLHAALGARFWLTRAIALRADLRWLRGPSYPEGSDSTLNASYGEFSLAVAINPGAMSPDVVVTPPEVADPDPDGDRVTGLEDECPRENGGANPDGCPTRDRDGDGIADAADACPEAVEVVNGFEDTEGCPDRVPDTDADDLDDLIDRCKDQAEDKDGHQDDDGCPDPDNDGDGVLDGLDACPGAQGPAENKGCADTDRDGDGIVDRVDNCPEDVGTDANRGCKFKQLVVLTSQQLEILDEVKFVTGSARLSPASYKLLDNIARVLLAHPEIWKVRVEGHTDNVGSAEKTMTLSSDRAASVVAYLVKKGVAPERLEAVGHGDTKPLEENSPNQGRARNRRVELHIVSE